MTSSPNLRDSERNVLRLLDEPTGYDTLTERLNITRSTARDHIRAIRDAGIPLGEKRGGGGTKLFFRSVDTRDELASYRPDATTSKAAHTKAKKDILLELEQWLKEDLTGRSAVTADGGLAAEPSNQDMVVHRSDDHLGAYYEDEWGNVTYDDEIATERIRKVNDRTFSLKARQEQAGVEFDTLHILLGGDGVHGEGIHADQPFESCLTLVDQIETYVDLYTEYIDRAVDEFDSVQIVCQNGNHGELRGDGMSPDANADDACFMMLKKRCLDRGYTNVTFRDSDAGNFTNFPMRGTDIESAVHKGHLRHGQDSLIHIGTSSGKNRWRGWQDKHGFDIGYRGHYHEFRLEYLDSRPVLMSGSICPPSDYEESMAVWSEPAATVHGVSDEREMTFIYPLDFTESKN